MSTAVGRLSSMTGFGRGEAMLGGLVVSAEVRTVNSRFLDVRVRLPRELTVLETPLRAVAGEFFRRGQADISVRIRGGIEPGASVELDTDAATHYAREARALAKALEIDDTLELSTLLALPGVARSRDPELEETNLVPLVTQAVRDACQAASEMRFREGATLGADLAERLEAMRDVVTDIEALADQVQKGVRERLEKRLSKLAPELEVEPSRLAQEVVMYADRVDITEEIVRLRSHFGQFGDALGVADPVGRKLEFLIQEIGREVNTIGSKAGDAALSNHVVELKTGLEKLREQVLNLE